MGSERDPLELAARALRHRDRSPREIDDRLARAGVGDAERAETLATLERIGYLDEGRFAMGRAAALAARGYGDHAIRADLGRSGVAAPRVDAAVAALEPERERALRQVERRGRGPRTAVWLARRGFGEDAVAWAARVVVAEGEG